MQNHAKTAPSQSDGHGKCMSSAFEVSISHGTATQYEQKKRRKKKCRLMSSKEVFEMVYGPRIGISAIEDECIECRRKFTAVH